MPTLRIALAQVNYTVGDLRANAEMIVRRTAEAAESHADIVAFPEMTLTGYPPEDLVLRASFRAASRQGLERLAVDLDEAGLGRIAVICGYLDDDEAPRNAAALLLEGKVVARYFKHHLPNYGVFDENRYFVPGERFVVVNHLGVNVAITICEDLWQDGGPFAVAGMVCFPPGLRHQHLQPAHRMNAGIARTTATRLDRRCYDAGRLRRGPRSSM